MNTKSRMKILKWTFVTLTLLGLLFVHFYAPRIITEIKNPLVGIVKQDYLITNSPVFNDTPENGKTINFDSFDNTKLCAFITYAKSDSIKGTIILLHGIRASKEHFINLSNELANKGYNSVALDSRAHGSSGGEYCTFGVKEKKDVMELISILVDQEKLNDNIGIWGQSLGGAIGLQSMGIDKRIKFGIIESTFTDFKTITNDYFTYHLGFNIRPLTNYLVSRSGKIADFDPEEAKPVAFCKMIKQPILVVHGANDKRIAIKYGKENFRNIGSAEKEFIEIENANHLSVWETGGRKYFNKLYEFIEENNLGNMGNTNKHVFTQIGRHE